MDFEMELDGFKRHLAWNWTWRITKLDWFSLEVNMAIDVITK